MTTSGKVDMASFNLGVLAIGAHYKDYEISVYAPKEHSILLDYLKDFFGGSIKTENSNKKKWYIEGEELDDLVTYLKDYMPQCEGRNKFLQWAKDKYEV
jgi:hypothetical protein